MDTSFQEKSLWLTLIGLLVAFGWYFAKVVPTASVDVTAPQLGMFIAAVVLLVITQGAGHIVIAIVDRRSDTDERDRLIQLRGTRNGAYVLAAGVSVSLCAAVLTEGNFIFTQVLLASWVLAQLVEIGSQLLLYRRGA